MADARVQSDIPPALTANEWRNLAANAPSTATFLEFAEEIGRQHAVVAIANAGLHDEDPRKLRHEHVELLRQVAEAHAEKTVRSLGSSPGPTVEEAFAAAEQYSQLVELADVLESYLPPDPAT